MIIGQIKIQILLYIVGCQIVTNSDNTFTMKEKEFIDEKKDCCKGEKFILVNGSSADVNRAH